MQRYWDGADWTMHHAPPSAPAASTPAPPSAPAASTPAGVIVTGPNHALHFVLTLFTFWMCGGWAWIWLIIALSNRREVQTVDAYGNVISRPRTGAAGIQWNKQTVWIVVGAVAAILLLFIIIGAISG